MFCKKTIIDDRRNRIYKIICLFFRASLMGLFLLCLGILVKPVFADTIVDNLENGSNSAYGSWSNPLGLEFAQENASLCGAGPSSCSNPHGAYDDNECACSFNHYFRLLWSVFNSGYESNTYTFNTPAGDGSVAYYTELTNWKFGSGEPVELGFNGSSSVKVWYTLNSSNFFDIYCQGNGDPVKFGTIEHQFEWFQVKINYTGGRTADCYLDGVDGGTISVPPSSLFNSLKFSNSAFYDVDDISESQFPPILTLTDLNQFGSNGTTPIVNGATTTQNTLMFKGVPTSPAGVDVRLQVEVEPIDVAFTGTPTATSKPVITENVASAFVQNLSNGQYHWQARGIDSLNNVSAWQEMSISNTNADFSVVGPRPPFYSIVENLENGSNSAYGSWSNPPGPEFANDNASLCGTGPSSCSNPHGAYNDNACACSFNHYFRLPWSSDNSGNVSNTYTFNTAVGDGSIAYYTEITYWKFGSGYPVDLGFNDNSTVKIWYRLNSSNFFDIYCQGSGDPVKFGTIEHQFEWFQVKINYTGGSTADCYLDGVDGGSTYVPYNSLFNSLKFNNSAFYEVDDISESLLPSISSPVNLGQFESDGVTLIGEGATTTGNSVMFQATLTNPASNPVNLQIEVQPSAVPFTGIPTATGVFPSAWGVVSATATNLLIGQYHWQARLIDSQDNVSYWQTESDPAVGTDFSISNLRIPVIIVPGIMGSYLAEASTGNQVWLNLSGYALSGEDGDLRKLEMFPLGGSVDNLIVDNAIEKVLSEDFYSGLIKELEKEGYKEGTDLFVFPYDWRYDVDCLAGAAECPDQGIESLDTAIGRILTSTGSKKVDIVAHSMGGLIAKAYIEKFGTSTIDKLITIATPNLGSPRATKILLYGDNMDIGKFGYYILNESTMKEISQNIPSVYQLLPSQEYFNLSGGYIDDLYDADNNGINGNLNYSDTNDFLANSGRNRYLLNNAVALHRKIDGLQVKNSFSISGCKTPTIDKIYILNKEKSGGYEYALRYTSGDGTVPLVSADYFGAQKYYAYPADHGKISSSNGVRQLVGAILVNKQLNFDFPQYHNVSSTPVGCNLSGTQISYHSPVTLSAYDQYGNHVGVTDNGDTEINIPGAQYDEIDGNKFIFLPSGSNYTISGQATARGSFNARVETVQDGQYTKESYFNEVPLAGTSTKVGMAIADDQESYSIKVDQTGFGTNVKEITPDSVLTETEMNDDVKPITDISLSGTNGNNGYYISAVKIDFTATDDNSGVLKTEYSLDGGITWANYYGEFTISQEGTTTILYSSTDKAGNREENKTVSINIDQTKPTLSLLLPQEGQDLLHSDKLNITYFAADNFSGVASTTAKTYLDGQIISSNTIDLFKQSIGAHQIKIAIQDLAGNQAEQAVNFSVVTSVDGTIADVNRTYDEKMITKIDAKNDLVNSLVDIKTFQEKYGQRIDAEKATRDKAIAQCLKHKNQAWCNNKIGTIFDRFEYQFSKINQAVIKIKYSLILAKLDVFLKVKWINQAGYNIMKEDIKYLISKI